jgi:hypothetical protein
VKVRETPDGPEATPEHDEALRVAARHGVPLRRVLEAAALAWARRHPARGRPVPDVDTNS